MMKLIISIVVATISYLIGYLGTKKIMNKFWNKK